MKTYVSQENRALLSELVRTDFKLRYQGSVLGYSWSLLKPLLLFVILYIVFVYFLKIGKDVPHYPVYLLLGIVLWNFFTEATVQSLGSIVGRGDLIRKIKIPRWLIVVSSSISATINLLLSLVVVTLFMVINHVPVSDQIAYLPLYIILLYCLAVGCAFILSAAYVKFRDLSYIWEIVLQAGFYATPIIYPLQMIKNVTVEKLIMLNPLALTIQGARHVVVTDQAVTTGMVWNHNILAGTLPILLTVILLLIGIFYFKRESKFFAENI